MTTLQQDLRALVAANGFEMVHTTLQEMMRQDYEFLCRIFKTPVVAPTPVVTVPANPQVAPPVAPPEPTPTQNTSQVVKKVVKITVRKAVEEPPSEPQPEPTPIPEPQPETTPGPPVELPVNTIESPTTKSKFRSPAEVKQFQKEAEKKKRAELDAKGISVSSLMTRDNLKRWIEDEGRTFAWVAREMIGCPDTLVSNMAKNYGIQSRISKKRGILMGTA